jgi:phospholipid-binding lipoprotein MlaA
MLAAGCGFAGALLLASASLAADAPAADSRLAADEVVPPETAADSLDALYDDDAGDTDLGASDPLERLNRHFFAFNEFVDRWAFRPLVRGYQLVVPEFARRSIHHAFDNLNTPVIVANELLQLRVVDAAQSSADFVLDTAFGVGGLFEVGEHAGLSREPADFGQTLARIGVGAGPYLVIPLLGPSTLRDSFGDIVDQALHPLTYLIGPGQRIFVGSVLTGSSGLSTLEANYDELSALRDSSVDFYAAMRSAYLQNREAMIQASSSGSPKDYDATSPDSSFEILPSSASISASSPSRLMIDEYSERLSASSETVPFK